jgi:hypothetical protein
MSGGNIVSRHVHCIKHYNMITEASVSQNNSWSNIMNNIYNYSLSLNPKDININIQFETVIKNNRYYNHVVSRGEKHAYTFSTSPDKFMCGPDLNKESYHVLLENKIPELLTDVKVSGSLIELQNDVLMSPNYFLTTGICLRYVFLVGLHLIESGYLETSNLNPIEFMQVGLNTNPNIQFIHEHYSLVPNLEDMVLDINKDLVKSLYNLSSKEERYLFLKETLNDIDIKVSKQIKTPKGTEIGKELFSLSSMYLYKGSDRLIL